MLGENIRDGEGVEIPGGGAIAGMGLLPIETDFFPEKQRKQVAGRVEAFGGCPVEGYEIHMGRTTPTAEGGKNGMNTDSLLVQQGSIYGTYLHGIFDNAGFRAAFCAALCEKKGVPPLGGHFFDLKQYKEEQFDKLALAIRQNLDMPFIYRVLEEGA
jgi:adenosylcobyric acid synthase